MSKWRVIPAVLRGKKLLNVTNDAGLIVASFFSEEDAARCVEAVNSVERLREALEAAEHLLVEIKRYGALRYELDWPKCQFVLDEIRAALVKEGV